MVLRCALQLNFNSVISQQLAFTLMQSEQMMPPVEAQPANSEEEMTVFSMTAMSPCRIDTKIETKCESPWKQMENRWWPPPSGERKVNRKWIYSVKKYKLLVESTHHVWGMSDNKSNQFC